MSWLKIPDSQYPQKPVRATVITFIALTVWCGLFLPFDEDVRHRWVWLVGYCGALSIVAIGIIRFGPRAIVLLVSAGLLASTPAVIGLTWLLVMAGPIEESLIWVAVSRYLLFGVIAGANLQQPALLLGITNSNTFLAHDFPFIDAETRRFPSQFSNCVYCCFWCAGREVNHQHART